MENPKMNTVSFYSAKDYSVPFLKTIVEQIIADHGGYERLFAKGKKVVIKPNLVVKKRPEGGATTHPAVLEAVLLCLLPHTKDITVAECSGGPNTEALMRGVYRETGIKDVCDRYQIPIHYEMNAVEIEVPDIVAGVALPNTNLQPFLFARKSATSKVLYRGADSLE